MTEYEMADLYSSMLSTLWVQISVLLTMLSGFLVASYIFSHRLNRASMTLFLLIYSFNYLGLTANAGTQLSNLSGLGGKIQALALQGQGFEWTVFKTRPLAETFFNPGFSFMSMMAPGIVMWAASIGFFFIVRRANLAILKAEAEAAKARSAPPSPQSPSDSAMP